MRFRIVGEICILKLNADYLFLRWKYMRCIGLNTPAEYRGQVPIPFPRITRAKTRIVCAVRVEM